MRTKRQAARSLIAALLLFLSIPLLFVCCTQRWLPDSSGFVYVSSTGAVIYYDLNSKSANRLVQADLIGSSVAVWPTGDRVVVARVRRQEQQKQIQILLYDLQGNQKHVSAEFPLNNPQRDDFPFSTYVSLDQAHVVSFVPEAGAVVYNVKQQDFRLIPKVIPLTIGFGEQSLLVDVSPLLPDGKGFLALADAEGEQQLAIYGWGEEEPKKLTIDPQVEAMSAGRSAVGVHPSFHWEMGMLMVRAKDGIITINPRDRTVTYAADESTKKLQRHAEQNQVLVVCELANGAMLQAGKDKDLQLWRPQDGGAVTPIFKLGEQQILVVAPAPNRQSVLVRVLGTKDQIRVVNVKGEIVAEIDPPAP